MKKKLDFLGQTAIDRWAEKINFLKKPVQYKHYLRFKKIPVVLDEARLTTIEKNIIQRRSLNTFKKREILIDDIFSILSVGSGINFKRKTEEYLRSYPSAGARYPLEVYLISMLPKSRLGAGIYHFNSKLSCLESISSSVDPKIIKKIFKQDMVLSASLLMVITAVPLRNLEKYGVRGWRYIFIEAGHLAQNIYLLACSKNIRCCGIGAFIDEELRKLLHLRKSNESPIYVLALG